MLKDITIGQYYPTGSVIHEMDPRTKLFVTFLYMVMLFLVKSVTGFIGMFVFLMIPVIVSRVPIGYILRGLKGIFLLILITFILNLVMTPGKEIYRFYFLTITDKGLKMSLIMATRLVLLVSATSLMTLVTSPISLTDGLEKLMDRVPLLRRYSHEMAMMMSIALRFIPTLMEETDRIINAQKSRGADFESGNIFNRLKAYVPVLIPLFMSAFQRAEDLALAMEARCYRGGKNRTRMKELKYTKADYSGYFYAVLFIAFVIGTNVLAGKGLII